MSLMWGQSHSHDYFLEISSQRKTKEASCPRVTGLFGLKVDFEVPFVIPSSYKVLMKVKYSELFTSVKGAALLPVVLN